MSGRRCLHTRAWHWVHVVIWWRTRLATSSALLQSFCLQCNRAGQLGLARPGQPPSFCKPNLMHASSRPLFAVAAAAYNHMQMQPNKFESLISFGMDPNAAGEREREWRVFHTVFRFRYWNRQSKKWGKYIQRSKEWIHKCDISGSFPTVWPNANVKNQFFRLFSDNVGIRFAGAIVVHIN